MRRQISFPYKLVVSFKQKKCVSQNAIVVGDLDNDPRGDSELAVGGIGGELAIYKFNKLNPWKAAEGLGSINCMCIGDIRGNGKNSLVVLTGEGLCHIFDISCHDEYPTMQAPAVPVPSPSIPIPSVQITTPTSSSPVPVGSGPGTMTNLGAEPPSLSTPTPHAPEPTLKAVQFGSPRPSPAPTPTVPPNSPNIPIHHSPSVTFQTSSSAPASPSESPRSPKSVLKPSPTQKSSNPKRVQFQKTPTKEEEWFTDIIYPSFSHRCIPNANVCIIADIDEDKKTELIVGTSGREVVIYSLVYTGPNKDVLCLQQKRKISVPEKVHSISASFDMWGRSQLYVGQKSLGTRYVIIDHHWNVKEVKVNPEDLEPERSRFGESGENQKKVGNPVEVQNLSRPSLSLEGKKQSTNLLAITSLDGSISLQEDEKVLWKLDVKQQLFSLRVLDLYKNGYHDIILSSWDGTTYLIDQDKNLVEFQFEDQLSAFTAGNFSLGPGRSLPCLIFVTFFDEIFIYYNITSIPLFQPQYEMSHEMVSPDLATLTFSELQAYKSELRNKLAQLMEKRKSK